MSDLDKKQKFITTLKILSKGIDDDSRLLELMYVSKLLKKIGYKQDITVDFLNENKETLIQKMKDYIKYYDNKENREINTNIETETDEKEIKINDTKTELKDTNIETATEEKKTKQNIQMSLKDMIDTKITKSYIVPNEEKDDVLNCPIVFIKNNLKIRYDFAKKLGSGSYGTVSKYVIYPQDKKKVDEAIYQIAVKFDKGDNDESKLIRDMMDKKMDCNVLLARKIDNYTGDADSDINFIYVMNLMDGSLNEWLNKTNGTTTVLLNVLDKIIKSLYNQMTCLKKIDNRYIFTDLKPENIGVILDEKGNLEDIRLIDLGSAIPDTDGFYVGTFPCCDFNTPYFTLDDNHEKNRCIITVLIFLQIIILESRLNLHFKPRGVFNQISKKLVYIGEGERGRLLHSKRGQLRRLAMMLKSFLQTKSSKYKIDVSGSISIIDMYLEDDYSSMDDKLISSVSDLNIFPVA